MNTVLTIGIYLIIALVVGIITMRIMGLKQWLVWAVTTAESEFGGGTGRLKLRYVYDLAVNRFGWIATLLPYSLFEKMVDSALVNMRNMIQTNEKINEIVNKVG